MTSTKTEKRNNVWIWPSEEKEIFHPLLRNEIDDELSKSQIDTDALKELLEELILQEECLDEIDAAVEEETKTDDLKEEVARALEYKEHLTLRKTRIRRVCKKTQRDAIYLSIYLSINLISTYLSIHPSIHPPTYLHTCLSV